MTLLTKDQDDEMDGAAEEAVEAVAEVPEPIDAPISQEAASPDPPAAVTQGRWRSRRKVTKKVQTKDDEGYLGL